MGDLSLLLRQTGFNVRGFFRNPRAVVFTVVFPVVLLVLFSSIAPGGRKTTQLDDGVRIAVESYFTAGIVAYSIMLSGFSSLLISLTTAREGGLLKRYRGTPMPAWIFLVAQILSSIVVVILMVVLLFAIGGIAYDVPVPLDTLPGLVAYVLLGSATMCALGMALTRIASTADASTAIGPFVTVILAFASGVFVQAADLPDWLRHLGRFFPLAHLAEGLQQCVAPGATGPGLHAGSLMVLAAWGIAGLAMAIRTFRWDPQGAAT